MSPRIVYSTDPEPASLCPRCGRQPCVCDKINLAPRQQTAYVQRDRKRRAGKTVTVITGLQHTPATFREQKGKAFPANFEDRSRLRGFRNLE